MSLKITTSEGDFDLIKDGEMDLFISQYDGNSNIIYSCYSKHSY